ncbi:MAG: type I restriction-modification enzyme R subunit C-terminal domain-containing protein [Thermodesulfobacteriota bacterium]|nr:type I restriction-modification enzyme R subunit C-terminal domain-containing protein [Thermodesulfobacteriota bacterium]
MLRIISSVHIEKDDLDYAPFDGKGGVGKMYHLFGDEMDSIIDEMKKRRGPFVQSARRAC